MADVTLTYKGSTIAEMSDTGTKTLKTAGNYCEGDIGVSYVKPESGVTSDDLAIKMITGNGDITELPSDLTEIQSFAFYHCENLKLTSLPSGITTIPQNAFDNCSNLALTSLPNNLTLIDYGAFAHCKNISLTYLPESITVIGAYAFEFCQFTTITFKGTPTRIGANAFGNCPKLTTINVPWAEGAVANAPWGAKNATINYNYTE